MNCQQCASLQSQVHQLRGEHPEKWWDEVKRLSAIKLRNEELTNQLKAGEILNLSDHEQANVINSAFLEPLDNSPSIKITKIIRTH